MKIREDPNLLKLLFFFMDCLKKTQTYELFFIFFKKVNVTTITTAFKI